MMNQVSSSVIILDRRSPLSFSLCWRYSAHTFSRVTLCSTVSSFGTHFAQTFLKLTSDGHNGRFSNTYCGAQFTFCDAAIIPHQQINLVSGLRRGWSAAVGPSPVLFSPFFKTTDIASKLTSLASSTNTLVRRLWISNGLQRSAVRNAITTLCLAHTSTKPAILHCYCL